MIMTLSSRIASGRPARRDENVMIIGDEGARRLSG
jgi:hypothetical protein